MIAAFAGILGLAFGSFLNVVAYRLPRGESLSRPRSRCPSCGTPVRALYNVPVLSWLALRGRCRTCRVPISARYPLVEALTAALCVAVVLAGGRERDTLIGLAFVLLLVPVAFIDLDHRIIPNKLTGVGAVTAMVLVAVLRPHDLPEHVVAGLAAGGFLLAAAVAKPGGMGMGDVKLAAVMGLFLGRAVAPALFVALIAGSLAGMALMARRGVRDGRKTAIPFGPWLALGGLAGLFAGDALVDWYLTTFL
jgi:leader peptidase (prepilin peptidase) / N-methyltransferase